MSKDRKTTLDDLFKVRTLEEIREIAREDKKNRHSSSNKSTILPELVEKERSVLRGKEKLSAKKIKTARTIVSNAKARELAEKALDKVDITIQRKDLKPVDKDSVSVSIDIDADKHLENALLWKVYLRQVQSQFFDPKPECGIPMDLRIVENTHHKTIAEAILKIIDTQGGRIVVYNEEIYVYANNRYMQLGSGIFRTHISKCYLDNLLTVTFVETQNEKGEIVPTPTYSSVKLSPSSESAMYNILLDYCTIEKNARISTRFTSLDETAPLLDNEQAGCVWLGEGECPYDLQNTLFCPSFGYNMLTGEHYKYTRDMFCSSYLSVDVDERQTKTPGIDRILHDQFGDEPGMIELFYECTGYLVAPSKKREVIITFLGDARSGKSTIAEALFNVIGNSQKIDDNTFKSEHGTQGIANARLLLSTEAKNISGNTEAALKSISGNDPILINRKFKGITSQRIPGKILIVNNEMPHITDPYLLSRMEDTCMTFKKSFKRREDHNLKESILKNELTAFLTKCVIGYRRLVDNKFVFTRTKNVIETQRQLERDNFSYNTFINSCCEYTPEASISSLTLYQEYCTWFRLNYPDTAFKPVGMNKFITTLMKSKGVQKSEKKVDGRRMMWLHGVTISVDNSLDYVEERLEVESNDNRTIVSVTRDEGEFASEPEPDALGKVAQSQQRSVTYEHGVSAENSGTGESATDRGVTGESQTIERCLSNMARPNTVFSGEVNAGLPKVQPCGKLQGMSPSLGVSDSPEHKPELCTGRSDVQDVTRSSARNTATGSDASTASNSEKHSEDIP